jgi:exodeoxyribonuclease VII large subunit
MAEACAVSRACGSGALRCGGRAYPAIGWSRAVRDRRAIARDTSGDDRLDGSGRDEVTCAGRHTLGLDPRRPLPVWRLAQRLREIVAGAVRPVWIAGEVVAPRRDARGHIRFTLRDERSRVECLQWANTKATSPAELVNGMQAVVLVTPMIYTRPLSLACVVSDIHETGEAAAKRRLDLLRMTLSREGLFAPARKRRLPTIPCCVGIITSRGSAAWHDVVAIARSRYPGIPLILVPAQMQGAAAPASIVAAIHRAEASRFFDVLIVTRGGGSAADLNVFNDERLARAIASSEVPIVTAVGHELDFSLADGVADARAATPSAAAALIVPMRRDLEDQLVRRTKAMSATVEHLVRQRQERLDAVRGNMARSAMLRVRDAQRHLDRLRSVLGHAASRRRAEQRAKVHQLVLSFKATLRRRVAAARSHHNTQDLQLAALSPNAIMTRGYVIARGASGAVLSAVGHFRQGQAFTLQLADGTIPVLVAGADSTPSTEGKS